MYISPVNYIKQFNEDNTFTCTRNLYEFIYITAKKVEKPN